MLAVGSPNRIIILSLYLVNLLKWIGLRRYGDYWRFDLETLTIDQELPTKNYTEFTFDRLILIKWMDQDITFEEAIGTRMFKCKRVPDVFSRDVFYWMNKYL